MVRRQVGFALHRGCDARIYYDRYHRTYHNRQSDRQSDTVYYDRGLSIFIGIRPIAMQEHIIIGYLIAMKAKKTWSGPNNLQDG